MASDNSVHDQVASLGTMESHACHYSKLGSRAWCSYSMVRNVCATMHCATSLLTSLSNKLFATILHGKANAVNCDAVIVRIVVIDTACGLDLLLLKVAVESRLLLILPLLKLLLPCLLNSLCSGLRLLLVDVGVDELSVPVRPRYPARGIPRRRRGRRGRRTLRV